ncbi:MAG: hypothetical protein QGG98_06565, partial [Pseudomonadales bacterium]|nr:hypothetical protein [Pseudomonadales bacterium]
IAYVEMYVVLLQQQVLLYHLLTFLLRKKPSTDLIWITSIAWQCNAHQLTSQLRAESPGIVFSTISRTIVLAVFHRRGP